MAEQVLPIEEEEDHRARRMSAWGQVHLASCQPQESGVVRKKDLSSSEIDRLDRTKSAATGALAQTEHAQANDRMQGKEVSKTLPAGTEVVAETAESFGIAAPTKIRSPFELSQTMGKNESLRQDKADNYSPKAVKENYLHLVLDLHKSMEEMIADCTNRYDAITRSDLEELGRLREEKVRAIEKYTQEVASKQSWATLETLARYLAYASSLAIGFMLLNAGATGPAAYLLIAAGGLGLAGSVASDMGLWAAIAAHFDQSQETQRHIAQSMEFALTLAPLGLALLGTAMASPDHMPTAFTWMATALSVSSTLGKSWSEKKFEYILAEIENLDKQRFLTQESAKTTSQQMQKTIEIAQRITKEVEEIISSAELDLS